MTRGGVRAGTGFLPKETAEHHRRFVVELVEQAVKEAGIKPDELDCVCYTKGPGMGGEHRAPAISLASALPLHPPLAACARARALARALPTLWSPAHPT